MMRRVALIAGTLILSHEAGAQSAEYLTNETIAAQSAEELDTTMSEFAEIEPPRRRAFWQFQEGKPFFRDTDIHFDFRGYDFDREDGNGATISQAFAMGGELSYLSGQWKDRLSVAASWYTSQGIHSPEQFGGTGLLGPGQEDISVLGKAYVELEFDKLSAQFYRQDFMLPYINRQDSRMVPNTHEAYQVTRVGERFSYIAGHITKIKLRTADEFIPMAQAAGVRGGMAGTSIVGLRYTTAGGLEIGGLTAYTRDAFNIAYAEANWSHTISDDLSFRFSAQYTDQRSVGRRDLGEFSTDTWGIRVAGSYRSAILSLAYTDTDEGAAIRSPFGGRPSYNSMMLLDFDRAGERSWRAGLSFHFDRLGVPALSMQINAGQGRHAINPITGIALAGNSETNYTIDYRPQRGWLEGLWIRLRIADADRMSPDADRSDLRLIIKYSFAML